MSAEDFEAEREARTHGKLVTVATFGDSAQAHLFRGRLEAAGIPALVQDEFASALYGLLNPVSAIKVVVHERDLERALDQARQALAGGRPGRARRPPKGPDAESLRPAPGLPGPDGPFTEGP